MPATVQLNILEGVRWDERGGVVRQIDETAIITGLTAAQDSPMEAYIALDNAGRTKGSLHPEVAGLSLNQRRLVRMPDPTIAVIALVYNLPAVELAPPGFNSVIEGGVMVEQKPTQIDRNDQQITVQNAAGEVQGGEVTALRPRSQETRRTSFQSAYPGVHARQYVGFVNEDQFNGDPAGQWLCAGIRFRLFNRDTSPHPTWEFDYEFWHSLDGWDPQVIYIDPATNKPPPGLVADIGYKTVELYTPAVFGNLGL